jgi:RNA polymerase sigma-70 factor, ECF subfamily
MTMRHAAKPIASPSQDVDESLIERAKSGDKHAFGELFTRHHGRIYATCARMLASAADAEDAVQHTFLEAWRCLPAFEGRSRFTTWLTRIAIYTCLGNRRKRARITYEEPNEASADVVRTQWAQPLMSPDDTAAHAARKKAVEEILQRIGIKKRAVLVMADFEGMTSPEIARAIDVPEATVRTRLFHARKELATLVRAHPAFADLFEKGEIPGRSEQHAAKLAPASAPAPAKTDAAAPRPVAAAFV